MDWSLFGDEGVEGDLMTPHNHTRSFDLFKDSQISAASYGDHVGGSSSAFDLNSQNQFPHLAAYTEYLQTTSSDPMADGRRVFSSQGHSKGSSSRGRGFAAKNTNSMGDGPGPTAASRGGFRLPPTGNRGGRGNRRGGISGRGSVVHSADTSVDEDLLQHDVEDGTTASEDLYDKALWNSNNTSIFDMCDEVFNYIHSSLRNVIERSFGVLKMKWRVLLDLPSYPIAKQSKIILACMALHNFIRDSAMADREFDMCDEDECYMPFPPSSSSQQSASNNQMGDEDLNMNVFRDNLANALFAMRS